ncbi:Nif3-like dinuclear metal center hexameric protein [Silvibacterium acidisoli]|uniref:Nif3-like dinuclear metal center hexameric protein n=1 Tax=Acidobacteriaceae bacterium ZG23-2 TaxID=2883246 RepID=UPI00406C084F
MKTPVGLLALTLVAVPAFSQTLTAGDAFQKIKERYGNHPPANTVDTLKAGDPSTPVTGIATTFMDTMQVLQEAAKRGDNLIISHEPTFYNHPDDTTFFKDDAVYKDKLAFIKAHHMVVYRMHDEIHATQPDDFAVALVKKLGWTQYVTDKNAARPYHLVKIPQTTLGELVDYLEKKTGSKTMRVVGDPKLVVTGVGLLPGASGLEKQVIMLRRDDVQVLVAGEASEWETVIYANDAMAQGKPKALILLGHEVSEEPGMVEATPQIQALFPGVRVDNIQAGQAMWRP